MTSGVQDDGSRREPTVLRMREIGMARFALFWEVLWPEIWPVLGIAGLFLAIAFSGALPLLPGWLHALILAAFVAALLWSIWRLARNAAFPSYAAAERRIERDSGLAHRPLTALDDSIAVGAGDDFAEALWRAHLARMRKALGNIRVGAPHPGLPRRDPFAFRLALALFLVLGMLYAGVEAPDRMVGALLPNLGPASSRIPATAQLWITPPAYTGLAPIFLRAGGGGAGQAAATDKEHAVPPSTISVPVGSKVLARLQGGSGPAQLLVGDKTIPFKSVDDSTAQLEGNIIAGTQLAIQQNRRVIGQWPIVVVPDLAPKIEFATPPSRTLRSALKLEYGASDDYGLASVKAVIRRKGASAEDKPIEMDLPLSSGHPKQARETSFHDFTPHPWAGLPVTIQLLAADEPGQVGASEPFETILPERIFNHPVARAIIQERKTLTTNPEKRDQVAAVLSLLASRPQTFANDIDVFLALIAARSRLRFGHEASVIPEVQQLMWDTALAIEDGRLSVAERELRDLQQKLMDALERNAPDKEIEALIAKLQEAIDRYLQAMAEQMMRNSDKQQPIDQNAQRIEAQDLHKMLDRLREMARTGARDAARQLLAQLQNMLENLRMSRLNPGSQNRNGAAGLMRGMDDLISQQDKLLQRTFRESQQGGNGMPLQRPGRGTNAADQDAIRRALGEIMRRMGEMSGQIPDALGRAERAMRDAMEALGRQSPGDAVNPEAKALDLLRQGRQAMLDGLRRQLGQQGDPQDLDAFGPARDPLGRTMPGFGSFDANDVRIPDHGAVQRAREIQEELQRRAGQRQRPPIEREYIDRLLKRF